MDIQKLVFWIFGTFFICATDFWIATRAAPTTDLEKSLVQKSPLPGCLHNGNEYKEGEQIASKEPCLNCTCQKGALRCQLQVCPYLEDLYPPPPGCILVERKGACCPKLHCPDSTVENRLNRQDPSGQIAAWKIRNEVRKRIVKQLNKNASDKLGCVESGTLYADGSAMMTSTNCEYCFCLKGKQVCTKPKCSPPMEGCTPRFRALACCPTHYDCNNSTTIAAEKTITTGEGHIRPLVANSASGAMRENDRLIDSPLPGPQQTGIRKSQKKFDPKLHSIQKRDSEATEQTKPIKQDSSKKEAESLFDSLPTATETIAEERSDTNSHSTTSDMKDTNLNDEKANATSNPKNTADSNEDSQVLDGHGTNVQKDEIQDKSTIQENKDNKSVAQEGDANPEIVKETPVLSDTMEVKVSTSVASVSDGAIESADHRPMETFQKTDTDSLTSEGREHSANNVASGHSTDDQVTDTSTSRSETISSAKETVSSVSVNVSFQESNDEAKEAMDQGNNMKKTDPTLTKFSQPALLPGGLVPLGVKEEASSSPNEYEDFDYQNMELPPSLPNLEIIPFVAADAVVGNPVLQLDDDERLNPAGVAEQRTPISHVAPSVTQSDTSDFCFMDGGFYSHGELISKPDPCIICRCNIGQVVCLETQCSPVPQGCQRKESLGFCCGQLVCEGNDRMDIIDTLPESKPIQVDVAGITKKPHSRPDDMVLGQDTSSLMGKTTTSTTLSPLLAFSVTFPSRPTSTLPSSPSSLFLRSTTQRPSTAKSKLTKPSVNNLVGSSALPTGPLKVEGCNIYGQMYRVGRIIEELSGPCIECKCTELGVGCAPLKC